MSTLHITQRSPALNNGQFSFHCCKNSIVWMSEIFLFAVKSCALLQA